MAGLTLVVLLATVYQYAAAQNENCPAHLPRTTHLYQYRYHCYEFMLGHPHDWYDAKADCASKGGYLTDMHNFPEESFIVNHVEIVRKAENLPTDKGIWIGMTDEAHEGTWTWVSGVPMAFTNWANNQPGMIGGMENCGLMESSGKWHDYPCHGLIFTTENHGWVCKYDITT